MPATFQTRLIYVEKMQRRVSATSFQKTAGVIPVPRKASRKIFSTRQLGLEIGDGAEIHANAARTVNIDNAADRFPKILSSQPPGNQQQCRALIQRQGGVHLLIATPTIQALQPASKVLRH